MQAPESCTAAERNQAPKPTPMGFAGLDAQPCCVPINAQDRRFLECPLNLSQLFQPVTIRLLNPPLVQKAASFYFIGSSDV